MKKNLLSNLSLKVMSVLVAILVWLLVVNIDDPNITKNVTGVVVQVQNEAYIESSGQMCLIAENQDVISVEVTGKRSVVDKIKADDITAVADLKQIVNMETDPIMVPISVTCTGISYGGLKPTPQNMSISLDDMMTQEFLVTVSSGETQPAKGYELGTAEAIPEKVKITGPQSLIQKIDKVIASIDVTDLAKSTTVKANLKIIDKNQDELSERQMGYLKYDIESPEVNVAATLWRVKKDVKIQAGYIGELVEGYKVEKITLTPDVVSVSGTEEALSQLAIDGNVIRIPDECIDVTGRTEDFEQKINIEQFLPEDIRLTTDTTDTTIASISILTQDSQEYSVSTKNIQASGVENGLQVVYETDSIKIRVRENNADLANLTQNQIRASIDFSGKTQGSYNMPVKITLPQGYEVVESVTTAVKLAEGTEN